ncbi:MAG: hypothetical protein ABIE22_00715 [archaeon]
MKKRKGTNARLVVAIVLLLAIILFSFVFYKYQIFNLSLSLVKENVAKITGRQIADDSGEGVVGVDDSQDYADWLNGFGEYDDDIYQEEAEEEEVVEENYEGVVGWGGELLEEMYNESDIYPGWEDEVSVGADDVGVVSGSSDMEGSCLAVNGIDKTPIRRGIYYRPVEVNETITERYGPFFEDFFINVWTHHRQLSSDGRQIAFSGRVRGEGRHPATDLWIMNADGTNLRRLKYCESSMHSCETYARGFIGTDVLYYDEASHYYMVLDCGGGSNPDECDANDTSYEFLNNDVIRRPRPEVEGWVPPCIGPSMWMSVNYGPGGAFTLVTSSQLYRTIPPQHLLPPGAVEGEDYIVCGERFLWPTYGDVVWTLDSGGNAGQYTFDDYREHIHHSSVVDAGGAIYGYVFDSSAGVNEEDLAGYALINDIGYEFIVENVFPNRHRIDFQSFKHSPGGGMIAYASKEDAPETNDRTVLADYQYHIWTMDSGGGNRQQVTNGSSYQTPIFWSSDLNRIYYNSDKVFWPNSDDIDYSRKPAFWVLDCSEEGYPVQCALFYNLYGPNFNESKGPVRDGFNVYTNEIRKNFLLGSFEGKGGLDFDLSVYFRSGLDDKYHSHLGDNMFDISHSYIALNQDSLSERVYWEDFLDGYDENKLNYSLVFNGDSERLYESGGRYYLKNHNNEKIEKNDNGWVITYADGTKYYYENELTFCRDVKYKWDLTRIEDVNGNDILFGYDVDEYNLGASRNDIEISYIHNIVDSAGRVFDFEYDTKNLTVGYNGTNRLKKVINITAYNPDGSLYRTYGFQYVPASGNEWGALAYQFNFLQNITITNSEGDSYKLLHTWRPACSDVWYYGGAKRFGICAGSFSYNDFSLAERIGGLLYRNGSGYFSLQLSKSGYSPRTDQTAQLGSIHYKEILDGENYVSVRTSYDARSYYSSEFEGGWYMHETPESEYEIYNEYAGELEGLIKFKTIPSEYGEVDVDVEYTYEIIHKDSWPDEVNMIALDEVKTTIRDAGTITYFSEVTGRDDYGYPTNTMMHGDTSISEDDREIVRTYTNNLGSNIYGMVLSEQVRNSEGLALSESMYGWDTARGYIDSIIEKDRTLYASPDKLTDIDFDAVGNLEGTISPGGVGLTYTYDADGVYVTGAENMVYGTYQEYHPDGTLKAYTDDRGNKWTVERDGWGRATKIIGPDGKTKREYIYPDLFYTKIVKTPIKDGVDYTVTYSYDSFGNLYKINDNGRITRKFSSALGHPLGIKYPDGTTEHYAYYGDFSLKNYNVTPGIPAYDAVSDGSQVHQLVSTSPYLVNLDYSYGLNEDGALWSLVVDNIPGGDKSTDYSTFIDGNTKIEYAEGSDGIKYWTQTVFDNEGNIEIIDSTQTSSKLRFDSFGRLRQVDNSIYGNFLNTEVYSYDNHDNLLTSYLTEFGCQENPSAEPPVVCLEPPLITSQAEYNDPLGRITASITNIPFDLGDTLFDEEFGMLSYPDVYQRPAGGGALRTSFTYDGSLLKEISSNGVVKSITFTNYDNYGRLTDAVATYDVRDLAGQNVLEGVSYETSWIYDDYGFLVAVLTPCGDEGFWYDHEGRLDEHYVGGNLRETYKYDDLSRLNELTIMSSDPSSADLKMGYQYLPGSIPSSVDLSGPWNGKVSYFYDRNNELSEIEYDNILGDNTWNRLEVETNSLGMLDNLRGVQDWDAGEIAPSQRVDMGYNEDLSVSWMNHMSFGYDDFNRVHSMLLDDSLDVYNSNYDSANRLSKIEKYGDPVGGPGDLVSETAMKYDDSGSRIASLGKGNYNYGYQGVLVDDGNSKVLVDAVSDCMTVIRPPDIFEST